MKKIHRYTHVNPKSLSQFSTEVGLTTKNVKKEIERETLSCIPCSGRGIPTNTKRLSLKMINKEFTIAFQVDVLEIKTQEAK